MMRVEHSREKLVGKPGPIGGHPVLRRDRAQANDFVVGAPVSHDADGAHRKKNRERLPGFLLQVPSAKERAEDLVGETKPLETLAGDLAEHAHGEPRTGKRLAVHDRFGKAELFTHLAHFVLEEIAQRFQELQIHALGKPADVVMGLDAGRGVMPDARFDHVGIERSLHQDRNAAEALGFFFEHANERLPDDPPLLLRIRHALQRADEAIAGVDPSGARAGLSFQEIENRAHFVEIAVQPVIHEDRMETARGSRCRRAPQRRCYPRLPRRRRSPRARRPARESRPPSAPRTSPSPTSARSRTRRRGSAPGSRGPWGCARPRDGTGSRKCRAPRRSKPVIGFPAVRAKMRAPGGIRSTLSPWLIHTSSSVPLGPRIPSSATSTRAGPYSRFPGS